MREFLPEAISRRKGSLSLLAGTVIQVLILRNEHADMTDLARAGAQLCTSVLPPGNFRRFAPQPTLRIVYPSNGTSESLRTDSYKYKSCVILDVPALVRVIGRGGGSRLNLMIAFI
ncbi:hypothetical protein J6590_088292 [Homalodisca vitripennis]|nr:hypothetical protein J6590_088292 [Homalodisca vitripennis]